MAEQLRASLVLHSSPDERTCLPMNVNESVYDNDIVLTTGFSYVFETSWTVRACSVDAFTKASIGAVGADLFVEAITHIFRSEICGGGDQPTPLDFHPKKARLLLFSCQIPGTVWMVRFGEFRKCPLLDTTMIKVTWDHLKLYIIDSQSVCPRSSGFWREFITHRTPCCKVTSSSKQD